MYILGISAFYHDSAAALIKDGVIVAAAQEECFTRRKHDPGYPANAVSFCLGHERISAKDLALVAFYDKPWLKFERILETYVAYAPKGFGSFVKAMPLWLKGKFWIGNTLKERLEYDGPIVYAEHHEAHAASAFYPSPFREAAVLINDGVGEWTTSSFGIGKDASLDLLEEVRFPHSLGLLYSAFTYYTGFKVNSAEYKMMGLAPYGEPRYVRTILDNLIDLKDDGSYKLDMRYFSYCAGHTMTNERFDHLFGGPPRVPEGPLTQKDMDLACSLQTVAELAILRMARHVRTATGRRKLCLAGGVALNCVANGKLLRERVFDDIWIQPAAGDAGGALGAALLAWHKVEKQPRFSDEIHDRMKGAYLGPGYDTDRIGHFLSENNIPARRAEDETDLTGSVAGLLAAGKVVGWFHGRLEFGPRALGARSILGDARSAGMQSLINLKIKFRESFRPFASAILRERLADYFETDHESPYMLLVSAVRRERRIPLSPDRERLSGIDNLSLARSDIPSVTHMDYSSRIQTVDGVSQPRFYRLLKEFEQLTGCPAVINTSFNTRGEPIVCTPEEAYQCFMRTGMDYLVLEDYILDKSAQPVFKGCTESKEFELD